MKPTSKLRARSTPHASRRQPADGTADPALKAPDIDAGGDPYHRILAGMIPLEVLASDTHWAGDMNDGQSLIYDLYRQFDALHNTLAELSVQYLERKAHGDLSRESKRSPQTPAVVLSGHLWAIRHGLERDGLGLLSPDDLARFEVQELLVKLETAIFLADDEQQKKHKADEPAKKKRLEKAVPQMRGKAV